MMIKNENYFFILESRKPIAVGLGIHLNITQEHCGLHLGTIPVVHQCILTLKEDNLAPGVHSPGELSWMSVGALNQSLNAGKTHHFIDSLHVTQVLHQQSADFFFAPVRSCMKWSPTIIVSTVHIKASLD